MIAYRKYGSSSSDDSDDSDDDDSSSSGSSSTTTNTSYTGRETLSRSEQEKVADAVVSALGSNVVVTSVEKTDTGVCITSNSGDVIYSKTDGSLATNEWEKVGTSWYYFDADKKAAKGWKQLGDKWYYLDAANGDCLMNTITPDGYTTDENGAWIQ